MLDYANIPLDREYIGEHKVCSIRGIMALAESIIQLAIADIKNRNGREKAVKWIMSSDRDYQFSFLNICDLLGVDPAQIRRAVVAYLQSGYVRPRRKL